MAKLFEETIQDNLNCRAALLLTSEAKEREGTRSQLFAQLGLGLHNWA